MLTWNVTCPNCGTVNEISPALVRVQCGVVACISTCVNCSNQFDDEQEYWRWLGLDEPPKDEAQVSPDYT
jgi:hypothetical protein